MHQQVTPFVGVWIETSLIIIFLLKVRVTPFVGVWIETYTTGDSLQKANVTPFVGVWIETAALNLFCSCIICHTLRGCVD